MTMLFLKAAPRLRRGTTLIELLIAMLILAIVCIAWLQIIGIQSAKREARRREAVERLAGMMDAFMCLHKSASEIPGNGVRSFYLAVNQDPLNRDPILGPEPLTRFSFSKITDQDVSKPFPDYLPDPEDPKQNLLSLDPIGYRLVVVDNLTALTSDLNSELFDGNVSSFFGGGTAGWEEKKWLIGFLYDNQGNKTEAGRPFFRLPVCLGL